MRTAPVYHIAMFICIITAAVLAYNGSDGWGWFLFAAMFMI